MNNASVPIDIAAAAPARFYQRSDDGRCLNAGWPRITTKESEQRFQPRDESLRVLMINAPIREWAYPNIMPIGHGYVGAVAVMDGHKLDVLDLNAARKTPQKGDAQSFDRWVESKVEERLGQRMNLASPTSTVLTT